ncbi:hypothetical protein [Streptomyces olivochromogenes]|uniref:hypothetical protein n=1 Tax=Streptomyces olivochromogenes TaxID=1963 RepID=UPI0036C1B96B
MSATLVRFALCLAYLAIWPFHAWGLALLVAISVVIPGLISQPDAEVPAAITTTVIMVVAGLSPQEAWKEPILENCGLRAPAADLVHSTTGRGQIRRADFLNIASISGPRVFLPPRHARRSRGVVMSFHTGAVPLR